MQEKMKNFIFLPLHNINERFRSLKIYEKFPSLKSVFIHQLDELFRLGPLIFRENFESRDLSGWLTEDLCCKHSFEYVDSPVYSGNQAAKFTLCQQDPKVSNGRRCELKRYGLFPVGTERWYSFKIFLPEDYVADQDFEIVTQWHGIPDFIEGETWRSPPLALITQDGKWFVRRHWDPNRVTKEAIFSEKIDLGAYQKSAWTSWVFHVEWSYCSDGLLEIWKDEDLVFQQTGPNTYNDLFGPYFKIGIYRPLDWGTQAQPNSQIKSRTLYVDDVRIGNAMATYKNMIY